MTTRRQRQVAERLHEEISILIQRKVRDPRLKPVTVTGVEVSPDLENARVYVSVLGSDQEARSALAGLTSATGFLRRELGAVLSLRLVPQLMFRLDESVEQGMRIDRLLDDIQSTRPSATPDSV
jgi:ribosome-binding factor A